MYRHFETELKALKEQILAMGGHVEVSVEAATQALIQRDVSRLKLVVEMEDKINLEHKQVDEACVQLLARQSPLAADLRLIVAVLKISTDLERMGDQAINISHNTRDYIQQGEPIKELIDIPVMAREVRNMVRNSLDAFVKQDKALAQQVLEMDDNVDNLKDKVLRDLVSLIEKKPEIAKQAMDLILIARNLERLGDHATNIAEDVIYVVSGEDIRHGGGNQ